LNGQSGDWFAFYLGIMAPSPTVLVSGSSVPAPVPVAAAVKFPVIPLLVAVLVGVLIAGLAAGGVVYYLACSGKLPIQGGGATRREAATPLTTHMIVLEPLLVNLADDGGNAYLRVAMALRVAEAADNKNPKVKEEKAKNGSEGVPAVRDTTLMVLGRQTAKGLMAADGKERLKAELKSALAEHNPDLKVLDVFFTDFLVQR
jgi:flagellar FliL protein